MWTFININGNLCDLYIKIITLSIRIKIIIKHCNDLKMKKDSNFKFNVVVFLNKFEFENYINIINHKQYMEYG
jgi:hypothetical protein